jgi:hypothetical protein
MRQAFARCLRGRVGHCQDSMIVRQEWLTVNGSEYNHDMSHIVVYFEQKLGTGNFGIHSTSIKGGRFRTKNTGVSFVNGRSINGDVTRRNMCVSNQPKCSRNWIFICASTQQAITCKKKKRSVGIAYEISSKTTTTMWTWRRPLIMNVDRAAIVGEDICNFSPTQYQTLKIWI